MRQIALGILLTAVVAASASAQTLATPSFTSALKGVTFTAPVSPALVAARALTAAAAPALQAPAAAAKKATVLVGADIPSTYYFRGYRQESDPQFTFQPYVDVGVAGESAAVNLGLWNSFHTGSLNDAGAGYYETDFYAAVTAGIFKATYTAYMYPNIDSSTIQELMFSVAYNDSESSFALAPSAAIAFEIQKSSGADKGIYLELGVAPGIPMNDDAKFTISIPLKFGFSLKDYYGGDGMGYFSGGVLFGVPLNDMSEVHFSILGYAFPGDAMREYNGEKGSYVVSGGFSVKF